MKPDNSVVSSNLKQINIEFDSFLTELREKVPNLESGKALEDPELEKQRLEQEIKEKEIIANKIKNKMIYWAHRRSKKEDLEITHVAKALYLTLHPDKLSQDTSENAKYLKQSVLHKANKAFYFDEVKIKCEEIQEDPTIFYSRSSKSKRDTPFLRIRKGKKIWIKKKKESESLSFFPKLLQNYFADIAFGWLIVKTYLLEIILTEAFFVMAFLLICIPSLLIEHGLVLGLGLLFTDGPLLIGMVLVLALPLLPGLLARAAERNFIEGYLFLIKMLLLAPLVIVIAPVVFISSLGSDKSEDPKAADQLKENHKAPNSKASKAKNPYTHVKKSKPKAAKAESEDALPESPASSPRANFRPGFSNGADDFD